MSLLSNLVYRFNTTSIKIPTSYLVAVDKLILKCVWEAETQNSQHSTDKERSQRADAPLLRDLL